MGRLNHLRLTLPRMVAQPNCECIVVDYSCPQNTAEWVEQNYPSINVVKIDRQKHFNPARARNAGAAAASTEWICFVDADVLLSPDFAETVCAKLDGRSYYQFSLDVPDIVGTAVCRKADFDNIGGFDDVYQGWGVEDDDLYQSLRISGVKKVELDGNLVTVMTHDDSDRTRFRSYRDRWLGWMVNRVYRYVKTDLRRITQSLAIPIEARRQLYQYVQSAFKEADLNTGELKIEVGIDQTLFRHLQTVCNMNDAPTEWLLGRRLVYSLNAVDPDTEIDAADGPPPKPKRTGKRLLINWVYYPAIGHAIEAFRVAQAFRNRYPDYEIAVALNNQTATFLRDCVPCVDQVYGVDAGFFLP